MMLSTGGYAWNLLYPSMQHKNLSNLNPCCAEFGLENIKVYMWFLLFLNNVMVLVVEILSQGR